MIVRWVAEALDDLDEIAAYIAVDDPAAAARIFLRIKASADGLSRFPRRGRPGRWQGTRELVVTGTPYLIAYRLAQDAIEILRVVHGQRSWPAAPA